MKIMLQYTEQIRIVLSIFNVYVCPDISPRFLIHAAGAPRIATLQPCAEHAEPWAGQVHVLSATQASWPAIPSGNSALRNAKSAHAETATFGFMWLSERIKNWDVAVKQLADCTGRENRGKAMCVVKGHQGPLWVALYLLDVGEQDLNTRLKVRHTLAVVSCLYTACGAT